MLEVNFQIYYILANNSVSSAKPMSTEKCLWFTDNFFSFYIDFMLWHIHPVLGNDLATRKLYTSCY
jgi:hypothetical protein